ncbi:putative membrane protein, partial [Chlamydia psittaci 06-1683]
LGWVFFFILTTPKSPSYGMVGNNIMKY